MKGAFLLLCLFIAPVFGGEQASLDKVLAKYKHSFHMDDWTVVVHLDTREHIGVTCDHQGILACGVWSFSTLHGDLYVMKLTEYTPEINKWTHRSPKSDQRDSVVHEMVHVLLQLAPSEEYAVATLTSAINP